MMKKSLVISLLLFGMIMTAEAQDYKTGVGLRGGLFNGVTLKHFVNRYDALEFTAALHSEGTLLAGMYQIHANAFDVPGLNWYYGPGAHLGFYEGSFRDAWFDNPEDDYVVIGVNGVVGMEYKIDEIPIALSADIIPSLNLVGHFGPWIGAGISVRYVF